MGILNNIENETLQRHITVHLLGKNVCEYSEEISTMLVYTIFSLFKMNEERLKSLLM